VSARVFRSGVVLGLLSGLGCATLDTSRMSTPCAAIYDACLNACPGATNPRAPPPNGSPAPTQPTVNRDLQIDVASCVNDCNERAKKCQ